MGDDQRYDLFFFFFFFFFLAFGFCGCNSSSRRIDLALSTALLISLTGYPLRAKSVIKV